MTDPPLSQIAAALYSGPPDAFVSSRNERAKAVTDQALAARIRALRKPSVAAWVVNVFASERSTQLGEALRLAQELREAQADLDAVTLARLGRDRRALTNRLAADAAALATARGERVTDATLESVRQTISAAFFDQDAAAAVASGRLVRDLEPSASAPLDLDSVVGGGPPDSLAVDATPIDEVARRRERRRAEGLVRDAEQVRARAAKDAEKAERDATTADSRIAQLTQRTAELEEQLSRTRGDIDSAREEVASAAKRRTAAADDLAGAERALAMARRALDELPGGS